MQHAHCLVLNGVSHLLEGLTTVVDCFFNHNSQGGVDVNALEDQIIGRGHRLDLAHD